jgi:hypothetical protein
MGNLIANDLLVQASFMLLEPRVNTTLGTAVSPGSATVTPGSMLGIYAGALLIVGSGSTQEVITVSSTTGTQFTATFAKSHAVSDALFGATFPTGQPNMFLFTQAEMLGYLLEGQQDFLLKVRLLYAITQTGYAQSTMFYTQPSRAIRLERIARVTQPAANTTLGTAVSPGVATVTPGSMVGIYAGAVLLVGSGTTQELITVSSVSAATVSRGTPTRFTATFAYAHPATDPTVSSPVLIDLLNTAAADLDMMEENWVAALGDPLMWFQDSLSETTFGLHPNPSPGGTMELWYSDRGPDSLALNGALSVPDIFTPALKYKVLEKAFSKDGEQRDSQRAKFCGENYKFWVLMGVKFMRGVAAVLEENQQRAGLQAVMT